LKGNKGLLDGVGSVRGAQKTVPSGRTMALGGEQEGRRLVRGQSRALARKKKTAKKAGDMGGDLAVVTVTQNADDARPNGVEPGNEGPRAWAVMRTT